MSVVTTGVRFLGMQGGITKTQNKRCEQEENRLVLKLFRQEQIMVITFLRDAFVGVSSGLVALPFPNHANMQVYAF